MPIVQVTDTAAAIARLRAAESALPAAARLFEDPYARLFCGDAAADEATARFLLIPFFREHVRLRTRFIDDCVRAAFSEGLRQLVILGVGFDCRSLRLPEIAGNDARVFEVDLAQQLDVKRAVLTAAAVSLPDSLQLVPCDLSAGDFEARLGDALARAGFETPRATAFVCEGVFGYLDDAAVDRSLRWIAASGEGTRVAFNYAVNRFDPERFAPRVAAAGFTRLEDHALDELHRRYIGAEAPPGGDLYHVAVAYV